MADTKKPGTKKAGSEKAATPKTETPKTDTAKNGRTAGARAKDVPQEVLDSAHRVWLAGLGALSRAEEEGSRFFRRLVQRGEEVEGGGRGSTENLLDDLLGKAREATGQARRKVEEVTSKARTEAQARGSELGSEVSRLVDERLEGLLHRMGVPSRSEIEALTARVELLNRHIEGLGGAVGEPPLAKTPSARPVTDAPVPGAAAKPVKRSTGSAASGPAPAGKGGEKATPKKPAAQKAAAKKGAEKKAPRKAASEKAASEKAVPKKASAEKPSRKAAPSKAAKTTAEPRKPASTAAGKRESDTEKSGS